MSYTNPKTFIKDFDPMYKSKALREYLEEHGWKYMGEQNNRPIFKIIY